MYKFSIKVQGSAVKPYEIKVYNEGKEVVLRCSCPAGIFGNFCKHVAAVLIGDITNVVEGEEHVKTLGQMTAGTEYEELALRYTPKIKPGESEFKTLEQIYKKYKKQFEEMGFVVEYKEHGEPEFNKTLSTLILEC